MVEGVGEEEARDVVLVVDDDPAVLSSLEFALQTEGFSVTTFVNGHDLLQRQLMPSRGCFVIDYYLPGMNGLEVALALRERSIDLPIILITTHPTRSLKQNAAAEGIEIVEKPLLGNTLSEAIRAAFQTERKRK
jgi:FixJ family two-component response regulator